MIFDLSRYAYVIGSPNWLEGGKPPPVRPPLSLDYRSPPHRGGFLLHSLLVSESVTDLSGIVNRLGEAVAGRIRISAMSAVP